MPTGNTLHALDPQTHRQLSGTHPRILTLSGIVLAAILTGLASPAALSGQSWLGASATRQDQTLDGNDWRLGSYELEAGVKANAQAEAFDESAFKQVVVPGEVQVELGLKGQELFHQTKELTSINEKEWWYRKHFKVGPKAAGRRTLLQFDGADYFASVWLNGKLLGEHEGTFVPFSFDVTDALRYGGQNLLAVCVSHPWLPKGRAFVEYLNGDFSMPVYTDTLDISHPPYAVSDGWDGLPAHGNATFAMGLQRSVHLTTVNTVVVTDLYARTLSIAVDGSAVLEVGGAVENAGPEAVQTPVELSIAPANFNGDPIKVDTVTVEAKPGKTAFSAEVRVKNAQLWWTWDSGAQNLYSLTARLAAPAAKGKKQPQGDEQMVRFGIRTIARDADMTYRINGKRVFVKASWFPIEDYFISRASRDGYERDLRLFKSANLNLLVNFTVVEKQPFYDLCDELGLLMVVQMPFAQFGPYHVVEASSTRREPFLHQADLQMSQIVTHLRTHPAIIEWAPLAESHDQDGGWGFGGLKYDQEGYDTFIAHMRKLVTELAPDAIFHPSLCDLGEKHFWMATAGYRGDSGTYQQHFDAKAGFVSEYGGISMSSYEKLGDYLTPKQQWDPGSQTGPCWFGLPIDISAYSYLTSSEYDALYSMLYRTEHYVDRDVRSPRELVDDTQVYLAFLHKYATEAYRRKKYEPIMGIRFWDFIELGPGFRFGIVDYDHIPKVSYWWMKRAQARLAVNFAYKDALEAQLAGSQLSLPVWAINDLDHAVDARVDVTVCDVHGNKLLTQAFNKQIPADGKAETGTLNWTLPQEPGVYVVKAALASSNPQEHAEDTTFVKVVPRAFAQPLRVLLIGQNTYATPIAAMLRGAGIEVNVRDEEAIAEWGDLYDGAALHAKYNVIWLANFELLAKVFDKQAAEGVKQAVAAGTGFIHTGGESSYHGGQYKQALVDVTPLAPILPVAIRDENDLVYGGHTLDDNLASEHGLKDIAATPGSSVDALELLQHYGLRAFNQVSAKPEAHTLLTIQGLPLLVSGEFGKGRVVAFTGFTPVQAQKGDAFDLGQQLIRDPVDRAYFAAFANLVALASGRPLAQPSIALLDAIEKPLFQTLKEQPATQIGVTLEAGTPADGASGLRLVHLKNGGSYAHLVRLRVEWDAKAPQPYLTEFGDNAIELLPGEERTISLAWRLPAGAGSASGTLIVDGANAMPSRVTF